MSPLAAKVLVLNRFYFPVHITPVRRAISLLYQDIARAVDEQYRTFDFASWSDLGAPVEDEAIGMVNGSIRVPRVVLLCRYDRVPRRSVRFTRANIYKRDRHRCQYCGRRFGRGQLNLDHVIPRSRGGGSTWDNVVCCCRRCNRVKGDRTPEEANMRLCRPPFKPEWTPFLVEECRIKRYKEWLPYVGSVDGGYWSADGGDAASGGR